MEAAVVLPVHLEERDLGQEEQAQLQEKRAWP